MSSATRITFSKIHFLHRQPKKAIIFQKFKTYTVNVLIWIYKSRLSKLGEAPIKMRISLHGQKHILFFRCRQWSGNISDKDFTSVDDITFTNLFGLGSMVESVYNKVQKGIKKEFVTTLIDIKTMINKYTINQILFFYQFI